MLFANRSDRLGTIEGTGTPIGPVHTFNTDGTYLNSGGITVSPLVVNTDLNGIPPFSVDTMGNLYTIGVLASGFPNAFGQYPFTVNTDGSMQVGAQVRLNNASYPPFQLGPNGTLQIGTPTMGIYGVKYPFYLFPNGDLLCNSIYGNLNHQTMTNANRAILCRGITISSNIVETGYYFNGLSSDSKLQLDFVTNPNIGVVDVSILCGSSGSSVVNSGLMSIRSSIWMHSGLQSFLAYRSNPLNVYNTTYIQASNTNTGDSTNKVSLNFKASELNPTVCDASIVVTAGNFAIGALNTGTMALNAGSQLILGPICPDIQIGANVSYLYSSGGFPSNVITLGNENTTVNILGQLVLTNGDAKGIILQNINGHLRQF
jgi:hypothetical protein